MDYPHDESSSTRAGIPLAAGEQERQTERLFDQILDGSPRGQQIYPEVLQHCRAQRISERQLRRMLAVYRADGSLSTVPLLNCDEIAGCDQEKLRGRIVALIGRLTAESLDDFAGLVALTSAFAARVQFLCDLVVYLFAERQKGGEPPHSDGRLYTEFFAAKLMWELDVVRRIGEQRPLGELPDEYLDWLTDRILDGEVLI